MDAVEFLKEKIECALIIKKIVMKVAQLLNFQTVLTQKTMKLN